MDTCRQRADSSIYQESFGIIKAPSVNRGHALNILSRITQAGLVITRLKVCRVDDKTIDALYFRHIDNPYYYVTRRSLDSGDIIPFTVRGTSMWDDTPALLRRLIGSSSDSRKCAPGTIRHEFGGYLFGTDPMEYADNALHGSDTWEEYFRERALFFTPDELYKRRM